MAPASGGNPQRVILRWFARRPLAAVAAGLALAGAAAGYSAFARHPGSPSPPARPPGVGVPAAPDPVVGPGTVIRYRRFYKGCGQEEVGAGPAPLGLYGMDRRELARAFPHARILRFSRDEVELSTEVPGCPYRSITATLRDGVVVAYFGTPAHPGPVYRVTRIRADRLSPRDRDRLATGVVVETPEQLEQLLEGLRK
jgi:hypothetical protein